MNTFEHMLSMLAGEIPYSTIITVIRLSGGKMMLIITRVNFSSLLHLTLV